MFDSVREIRYGRKFQAFDKRNSETYFLYFILFTDVKSIINRRKSNYYRELRSMENRMESLMESNKENIMIEVISYSAKRRRNLIANGIFHIRNE